MEDLKKLINERPLTAFKILRDLADEDTELQDYLNDFVKDTFEDTLPEDTKAEIVRNWFESEEADQCDKTQIVDLWAMYPINHPAFIEIIRDNTPETFLEPEIPYQTTLNDAYKTETLNRLAEKYTLTELENLAK